MHGLRLRPGEFVNTKYRVLRHENGRIRALWRIVWNGDQAAWFAGDGFFAHKGTGWRWCPEDFRTVHGIAWTVSGMGGADDDSQPISKKDALAFLATHGVRPDSIDLGKYPSDDEQNDWQQLLRMYLLSKSGAKKAAI